MATKTCLEKRPTRKELIAALRFIAFVPQTYYASGPEYQARTMSQLAWEILQRESQALLAREEALRAAIRRTEGS